MAAAEPITMKSPPVKKAAKPKVKKPSTHPKYSEMIRAAVENQKEKGGSSRQNILKYIISNYGVGKDVKAVNTHLKLALKAGVKNGTLKQSKGTGATGSFKVGEKKSKKKVTKKPKSPEKTKAAKKPKTKKPAGEKKKKVAKAKKVKKPKAATPKPTKAKAKNGKPKTKKSPKKKAAAKK